MMAEDRRRRALPPTNASRAAGVPLATGAVATEPEPPAAPEPATPAVAAPTAAPEPAPAAPVTAAEPAKTAPAAPTAAPGPQTPQRPVQPRLQPAAPGVQWSIALPAPANDMDPATEARWAHWLNATAGKFGRVLHQSLPKAQGDWGSAVADARAAGVDENVIVAAALRARVPVPEPGPADGDATAQ